MLLKSKIKELHTDRIKKLEKAAEISETEEKAKVASQPQTVQPIPEDIATKGFRTAEEDAELAKAGFYMPNKQGEIRAYQGPKPWRKKR